MKNESINIVTKPISSDVDPNSQSPEAPRDSLNGTLTGSDGIYEWTNRKGDKFGFNISSYYYIVGWCVVRDVLYTMAVNKTTDSIYLYSSNIPSNPTASFSNSLRWTGSKSALNISENYPFKRMLGFYENEDTIRLYWTDGNSAPGSLTVSESGSITTIDKFVPWTPIIENVFGVLSLDSIISGGNLFNGNYFFVWQYYTEDGYYTDYSAISNPISLVDHISAGSTNDDYHEIQGDSPENRTSKGIRVTISDIDDDYHGIRVAFFFSGAQNIIGVGTVFADYNITGTSMDFDLLGSENLAEITIDDLITKSITLEKIQDFDFIKYKNVIGNFEESQDLDIGNKIPVNIGEEDYSIILDTMGSPVPPSSSSFEKSLAGIKNIDSYSTGDIPYKVWYRATSTVVINGRDSSNVFNYSSGDRFQLTEIGILISGTIVPIVKIKKFRKGTVGAPSSNHDDYEWDEIDVDNQFYNFKNPLFSKKLKGYPSDQKIRLGIVFWDHYGKPMFTRWLEDNTVSDYTTSKRGNSNYLTTYPTINYSSAVADQVNGNVRSLIISDLDLTDMVDSISGFSIVRVPIISKTIATGIINKLQDNADLIKTYPTFIRRISGEANRFLNWYSFYSPEHTMELSDFEIQDGDYLENLYYLLPFNFTSISGDNELTYVIGSPSFYQKFLLHVADQGIDTNGIVAAENEIDRSFPYNIGDGNNISFDGSQPSKVLQEQSANDPTGDDGYNGKLLLIKTKNDETNGNPVGTFDNTTPYGLVVAIKRNLSNPYGGDSDASLALNEYISIGHFQPINAAVLASVDDGAGNYIFNEIQVFGGDQFVTLNQYYKNYKNEAGTTTFSQGIVWPLESKINLDLRNGYHLSKTRSYHITYNPSGIRFDSAWANVNLEDFKYNDGYSSVKTGDIYPAVPFISSLISKFDTGVRWSNNKNIGENVDNYIRFASNNFKLVPYTDLGSITNVRENGDYLVFWQEKGIGFFPVQERTMRASEVGSPVQLGIGGEYERSDKLNEFIGGNLHSFSLVKSEIGFHWFDFNNLVFMTMPRNMQLSQESIIKGYNNFLKENIDPNLRDYNSPLLGFGITSGFDSIEKEILMSFIQPNGNDFGMIYSLRSGGFHGRLSKIARNYITTRNFILKLSESGNVAYVGNNGDYNSFMGSAQDSYIEVIVNDPAKISKIFDNFELNGSQANFDKIEYETIDGTITEIISDTNGNLTDRNYKKKRNQLLAGSIPKNSDRKRLNGFYLKIRFYVSASRTDNQKVSLVQLNTVYRKAY